jgi:hypothetical protein
MVTTGAAARAENFESDNPSENLMLLAAGIYYNFRTTLMDAEMTAISPTTAPVTRTAAAERMRRYRQRRRDGLRCLMIELRETEIDALISNGLLAAEDRQDYDSLQSAFYSFLDDAFEELRDA